MSYFARFSPVRAYRDLKLFLSYRSKHELWFAFAAVVATGTIMAAFLAESGFERTYEREIVYFDNWPSNRTDAEIIAKQKIDQVAIDARRAELKAAQDKRQAEFKKADDALERLGI